MNLQLAVSAIRWAWPVALLLALSALLILISPSPAAAESPPGTPSSVLSLAATAR